MTRYLITSPDISVVSGLLLALGVVICQALWCSWGILAHDLSNELVGGSSILLIGANLICYLMRRSDLLSVRLGVPRTLVADLGAVWMSQVRQPDHQGFA